MRDIFMTLPIVKIAKESDEVGVIDVLKLAFVADPATRWVWPDPHQYLLHFSSFVKAFGGKAFAYGSAHYVGSCSGAALWLPPNVHPDVEQLIVLLQSTGSDDARSTAQRYSRKWIAITQKSLIGIYHFLELIHFIMEKDSAPHYCIMH